MKSTSVGARAPWLALFLFVGACASSPSTSGGAGASGDAAAGTTDAGGTTGAAGSAGAPPGTGGGAAGADVGGAAGTDAGAPADAPSEAPATDARGDGDAASVDARDAAGSDTGTLEAGGDTGAAAGPLHVLLIGNSFTIYNDLDVWLHDIAAAGSPQILTKRVAVYGMTLEWHWNNDAQAPIKAGYATGVPWSHVVLQGYSSEPLDTDGSPAPATSSFQVYAAKLAQLVKDQKAMPVMLETWAYRSCFSELTTMWGKTPDKMQDGLLAGYTTAATANGALLAKVGEAWRELRTKHPEISLDDVYDADCKHPKVWGTYLAAATIYVRLTGHAVPAGGKIPAGMPASVAQTMQALALAAGQP